jgi:molybdate transport system permease protein
MKKRKETFSPFEVIGVVILLLITLFITSTLLAVVAGGVPYLPEALGSDEVRFSIRMSLTTASISTAICFGLSLPAAYALTHMKLPFKKLIQTLIELPISLPYLVLGLCLLILFSSDIGIALKNMGLRFVFDPKGIVVAQIIVNLPFVMRLVRTAFSEVDGRLEFIAGTLGAHKWRRFLTVTLPLSRHAILAALILTWSRALGEFGATLMLVGVTRMKTETLPTSIYLNIATGDNGLAMASAIILLAISSVSIIVTNYLNNRSKEKSRTREREGA